MSDNYFVISDSGGGIQVDGPKTRDEVAAMLRDPDDGGAFSRDPVVLNKVPPCNKGYFYLPGVASKVLVIRGEVVSRDALTACPCGGGEPFKACHGAEEPRAAASEGWGDGWGRPAR